MTRDQAWKPLPDWVRALVSPYGSLWLPCVYIVHMRAWALEQGWAAPLAISSPVLTVLLVEGWIWRERRTLIKNGPKVEAVVAADPAEIGRRWLADSSLKEWFPLTAARLEELEIELASAHLRLRAQGRVEEGDPR